MPTPPKREPTIYDLSDGKNSEDYLHIGTTRRIKSEQDIDFKIITGIPKI
jgi:hypothetical protein